MTISAKSFPNTARVEASKTTGVSPVATDLASALLLVNDLRQALINAGILA